ncbi:HAD-IIB family hydrolase [Pseudocolwellia sp. HL-MZ19]|uniref:HAD-IIB family hydrolase n=1 Tax=Pseudocolwellia sp. HL-MZ19 TaxID=3400846 RepID=UPI003CF067A7
MTKQILIFSDLDGTLMDHYTYKSTEALPVIKQLNSANVPIVLTTSKTIDEVKAIQSDLHISDALIVENGAAIFLPKALFKTQPKDTNSEGDYWVKSFCPPRQHWLDIIKKAPTNFASLYKGFSTLTIKELAEITGLTVEAAELAKNRHFGEPIHWMGDESSKLAFIEYLETAGATILHGGRFFHVSGESDKGRALNWLTQYYKETFQFNNISSIALGDGKNDIAMLEAADYAVQIRSPVHDFPELKKHINVIQTESYGPAGWAEALHQILPEPLPMQVCPANIL